MGPGEYAYIYRLVYSSWRQPAGPANADRAYNAEALQSVLEPYEERLLAGFDPTVDPVELIFQNHPE
jgi:hypothetical protein